jgi:hypothetical protein
MILDKRDRNPRANRSAMIAVIAVIAVLLLEYRADMDINPSVRLS